MNEYHTILKFIDALNEQLYKIFFLNHRDSIRSLEKNRCIQKTYFRRQQFKSAEST